VGERRTAKGTEIGRFGERGSKGGGERKEKGGEEEELRREDGIWRVVG
jgi:hypothetical protein